MKKILLSTLLISLTTLGAAEVAIPKDSINIKTVKEKISIIEEKHFWPFSQRITDSLKNFFSPAQSVQE